MRSRKAFTFLTAVVLGLLFSGVVTANAETVTIDKKIPDLLAEGFEINGTWGSKIEADYTAPFYEFFTTLTKGGRLVQCMQRFDQRMHEGVHICVEQEAGGDPQ